MDQARTHTNTPPAETIALKSEPTAASVSQPSDTAASSSSPGGLNTMTTAAGSPPDNPQSGSASPTGAGPTSLKQPNPTQHLNEYLQDVRSLDTQGCITPSQQQSVQDDDSQQADSQQADADHHDHQHNSQPDSSFKTTMTHNNTTIFKPFDIKTGQFIPTPTSAASTGTQGGPSSSETVLSVSSTASSSQQSHFRTDQKQNLTRLRKVKFRSHSVPTILHSSLRRLNTHRMATASTEAAVATATAAATAASSSVSSSSSSSVSLSSSSSSTTTTPTTATAAPTATATVTAATATAITSASKTSSMTPLSQQQMRSVYPSSANNISSASVLNAGTMTSASSASQFAGIKKKKHGNKSGQYFLRNAILMSHRLQSMDGQEISLEERTQYIKSYAGPMPLPPINLQCLREIDLSEIVKNPQLRHDIVFDPLLQFRPNLDGERGIKKRQIADKYWADVENEIFVYNQRAEVFDYKHTRLVPLFDTLKDVLVTIVPQKEISTVENVLDTKLLIQELLKGSLIMTNLSDWLAQLFKHHCAPMRDPWVDGMQNKFREAQEEKSVVKLVEALKLVFQILEAMKLDIANHQIRILRPALLSNAVEFEKQYFQSLMSSQQVNLKSSLKWFKDKYNESFRNGFFRPDQVPKTPDIYRLCIKSIISLLSCRKMVREYPTSLSFDHARLILLRADIRQAVCLLVCKLLFKQLVANDTTIDRAAKEYVISNYSNRRLKEEIVSIITDEHGNCRWTKNTISIAIHICKTINELKQEYETLRVQNARQLGAIRALANTTSSTIISTSNTNIGTPDKTRISTPLSKKTLTPLDSRNIDFAKSWLSKQTQPLSEVYGVLENRVFNSLEGSIFQRSNCTKDGIVKQDFINLCTTNIQGTSTSSVVSGTSANVSGTGPSCTPSSSVFSTPSRSHHMSPTGSNNGTANSDMGNETGGSMASLDMEEFESLYRHLYTVVNFHWSVFGCHYVDALGDKFSRV
ncbi:Sok1p Ecym_5307 [Eremothecium cymbalariae DBVPG|uniref:Uncharacterized protein n=1 Tax=Eremothecium cymbalariae (strain CBS 270.75 / DBVPG 7215 / KCTC 17166 / NRRL Y-17582) TaxID=931890 RepID=I6NDC6_ERECY|nr:hypothetical protein Ecym_5307 [Eremothecium cymbalariae DBVPG\